MKFSEQWLRTWINPPLSTSALVQQFTMAGLEVDSVTPVASLFDKVVVGEVLSVMPHPNAEKLKVCQVTIGQTDTLSIVCGASNVQVGMRVPTALVGAHLPNDVTIRPAKLRGIESQGMLCSAKELGLAETSSGLLSLPSNAPLGEDVRHYLQLDDVTIDVDLTPNRGDCLGIEGLAREVNLWTGCTIVPITCTSIPATVTDVFPVTVAASQACPRYVGRVIKHVNARAPTPLWMQERLRRSGLRSINAIVDITNYVLLELGQPMHAFDLAKLSGGILVRKANPGESLTLLDGQTVQLDDKTLVIADHCQAQAMAGIMGGQASAVSDATQDIFLESAFFTPHLLAGCGRRYGLQTDSSYRFERGVDWQLQRRATERATALLLEIVGGQAGPVIEVVDSTALPSIPTITLRENRIQRLLGQGLAATTVENILTRADMTINKINDKAYTYIQCEVVADYYLDIEQPASGWHVQPPSFRFDIALEADLIEELARVYGYNKLIHRLPQSQLAMHPPAHTDVQRVRNTLVEHGYQEAITYSFVNPELQAQLTPKAVPMCLANPISNDMAVMRTTLWTGLLQALLYNQKRQQSRIRLFEIGLRFIQEQGLQQEKMVAGVAAGPRYPEQWGIPTQPIDFFDIKADVEALLELTGRRNTFSFQPATHPALHPGQTAGIYQGATQIGWLGAIHPRLIKQWDLLPPVYVFELSLALVNKTHLPEFKEVSKYPGIRRDIAVVVNHSVSAAELLTCIRANASDLLIDLQLFDVYQGEGVELGKKSLAIGLIFQAFSRNLTESEIDTLMLHILDMLKHNLDAHIRK